MLDARPRPVTEAELRDQETIWRTLLWDGAPASLVSRLANSSVLGLAHLTHSHIAQLSAEGHLATVEDCLLLHTLALEARHRRAVAGTVGAHKGPRLTFTAEAGMVACVVRPDLRLASWFGIPPHQAGEMCVKLAETARDAMARMKRDG